MDNIRVMADGNNFFVFMLVLVAIMGIFVLVGNVIKTIRELKKPHENIRESLDGKIMALENKVERIETVINSHSGEINDIRHTNRIQCQAVRALLNHAIHDGNTDEMLRAAGALDDYLTDKI